MASPATGVTPAVPLPRSGSGVAAGEAVAAAAAAAKASLSAASTGLETMPTETDYYMLEGRLKRRRTSGAAAAAAALSGDAPPPSLEPPASSGHGGALATGALELGGTHEAAGSSVFVTRRKLLRAPSIGSAASGSCDPAALSAAAAAAAAAVSSVSPGATQQHQQAQAPVVGVLVHFGWAPGARGWHEMFGRVASFGEASAEASGARQQPCSLAPAPPWPPALRAAFTPGNAAHLLTLSCPPHLPPFSGGLPFSAVDDYQLLSDTTAAATLTLRPGAAVTSWDALVRRFVEAL